MKSIHHQLLIGAPAEKIYNAITTQEGLSKWWTPDTKAKAEVDSISRFAFGTDYYKEMKITALKHPEYVQWICVAGAGEWIGTTITFHLQPGDKKNLVNAHPEMTDQVQQLGESGQLTLLIFQHDDWKACTPMFAECNYTWGRFLRSLKLFCETGTGLPWPHQHQSNLV